jgi:hypothetical protein
MMPLVVPEAIGISAEEGVAQVAPNNIDININDSERSPVLVPNIEQDTRFVGFVNTAQVSQEKIITTLCTIVDRGDPVFILDFF